MKQDSVERVVLNMLAPVHFGTRGVGQNDTAITMTADTLFSACCQMLGLLEGDQAVVDFLQKFPTIDNIVVPPFRITSLMPCIQAENQSIYLLPMPKLRPKFSKINIDQRKEIKKIDWVSHTIFQRLVSGDELDSVADLSQVTLQDRHVWLTKKERDQVGTADTNLWKKEVRPRVTVDRITNRSTVYSVGLVRFAKTPKFKVNLYALIRWENADPELRDQMKTIFEALGDEGIGGRRNIGYGQFQPAFEPHDGLMGAKENGYFTTLSPYIPQPNESEVVTGQARYDLQIQRGWITMPRYNNLYRPTVRLIKAGSVLHWSQNQTPVGRLADATPGPMKGEREIHRYGLAWPVPVSAQALIDD